MKYVSFQTIHNVLKFEKHKESIIFSLRNQNIIYKYNSKIEKSYENDSQIKSFTVFNDEIIILGENKILDKGKVIPFKKGVEFLEPLNNHNLLIKHIDFEKEQIDFYLYNYKNSSKLKLNIKNQRIRKIYKHFLLGVSIDSISIYNINLKKKSNTIFFNNLLEINTVNLYGNIQQIKNRLFFFLFDSSRQTDTSLTYCFDIISGKELWRSNDIGGWLKTFQNKIYSLHIKTVKILNPETLEINTIDLNEQLSILDKKRHNESTNETRDIPFRFSKSVYSINKDILYFTQTEQNTIGAINLKTKELIWNKEIKIESGEVIQIITDIKINNSKLYVQDSGNTLHIFEEQK